MANLLLILLGSKLGRTIFYKPRFPLQAMQSSFAHSKFLNFDFYGKTISSSTWHHQYASFSCRQKFYSFNTSSSQVHCNEENGNESGNESGLGVEIISIDNIKPSIATPHYLRTYKLSSLDQMFPNVYVPSIYFYQNNNQQHDTQKLIVLKQSLSETLNRFYPLAGKLQGDQFIDCNDEGVYFVEAKVNNTLHNILDQPDNKCMHQLLPFKSFFPERQLKSHVLYIKATVFDCGGIAIGLCTSHKIIDGYSIATFLNDWAATARGSSNIICPSYTSPSIFLHHPSLNSKALLEIFLAQSQGQGKRVTKRFVFSAESLKTLKKKVEAPSRVLAVIGLIWKCAISACTLKQLSSILMIYVNIRNKSSPPLPPFSIGNIFLSPIAQCTKNYYNGELPNIVSMLKTIVEQVDADGIERMKGKEGIKHKNEFHDALQMLLSNKDAELMMASSMCNSGLYETDFGWGNPIWVSVGSTDSECNFGINFIYLMDTKYGNGIEAFVTLNESDMCVLERDMELLSYAALNPSPLQIAG